MNRFTGRIHDFTRSVKSINKKRSLMKKILPENTYCAMARFFLLGWAGP